MPHLFPGREPNTAPKAMCTPGTPQTMARLCLRARTLHCIVEAALAALEPLQQEIELWEDRILARMHSEPFWAWSEIEPLGDRIRMLGKGLEHIQRQVAQLLADTRQFIGPRIGHAKLSPTAGREASAMGQAMRDAIDLMERLPRLEQAAMALQAWYGRLEQDMPRRPSCAHTGQPSTSTPFPTTAPLPLPAGEERGLLR